MVGSGAHSGAAAGAGASSAEAMGACGAGAGACGGAGAVTPQGLNGGPTSSGTRGVSRHLFRSSSQVWAKPVLRRSRNADWKIGSESTVGLFAQFFAAPSLAMSTAALFWKGWQWGAPRGSEAAVPDVKFVTMQ